MIANGLDPRLVKWWPGFTAPDVEATCPGCGRRAVRSASSWSGSAGYRLVARFGCVPTWDSSCYQVFETMLENAVPTPPGTSTDDESEWFRSVLPKGDPR